MILTAKMSFKIIHSENIFLESFFGPEKEL